MIIEFGNVCAEWLIRIEWPWPNRLRSKVDRQRNIQFLHNWIWNHFVAFFFFHCYLSASYFWGRKITLTNFNTLWFRFQSLFTFFFDRIFYFYVLSLVRMWMWSNQSFAIRSMDGCSKCGAVHSNRVTSLFVTGKNDVTKKCLAHVNRQHLITANHVFRKNLSKPINECMIIVIFFFFFAMKFTFLFHLKWITDDELTSSSLHFRFQFGHNVQRRRRWR